jgi:hypothetical protein
MGPHAMARIRQQLPEIWQAGDLAAERSGTPVKIAGQVICRQRPGMAKEFVFSVLKMNPACKRDCDATPFSSIIGYSSQRRRPWSLMGSCRISNLQVRHI